MTVCVDEDGVEGLGELIYAFGQPRHSEANEEHGFNQDHGEFQVSGNAAGHTFVIGHGMAATVIATEHINKKNKPTEEERAHEPMAKIPEQMDLIDVFVAARGLAADFVAQSTPIDIATTLP